MFNVRFYASTVMVIALIVVVYILPIEFFIFSMCVITFLAIRELLNISKNKIVSKYSILLAIIGSFTPVAIYTQKFAMLLMIFSIVFSVFLYLKNHENLNFNDVSFILLATIVLPNALNSITSMFLIEHGKILILIPMICAWASDIFAYLVGRKLGKTKLAPTISPNKTVEGSIGGILGAVFGMLFFGIFTQNLIEISPIFLILCGALGSIFGQMGDLFFSMIKRQADIKDYSNLIPGHGGILDRFDSVIFTAPIALAILNLI